MCLFEVWCSQDICPEVELLGHSFPGGSDGKVSACNAGDWSSIPGSGRSPGEGNGNLFQDSCLGNSMDRGAWQVTVHGVAESDMTEQLTHGSFIPSVLRNLPIFSIGSVSIYIPTNSAGEFPFLHILSNLYCP